MSFPSYPAFKDSGGEWLGVVPEHWGVKPLRYLGCFRKGLMITKADLTDTGIPCLNYGEVHSLYPFEVNQDIQPLKRVPAEYLETDPSACVKYGEFVFADTSEDLDGVGNFTHVSGMEPLFAGYHTIIYSLNSEVSSRFLAYCLESFAFRTQLRMGVKGVKVFSVTQEILRGGIAWIPTMDEQTQIARFLDHETARIEALIEEQQRLIKLLKEKRQAVISQAVTKGLDPTLPMKDTGAEWLGHVPAHWNFGALRWYATIQGGVAKGKDYEGRETVFMPYLRVANVQNGFVDLSEVREISILESEVERYSLRAGDVLMNEGGDNDKLGRGTVWQGQIVPCLHQNHVFAIRPNDFIMAEWLAAYTQSEQARIYFFLNSKQSTNLASISASNVMSLLLPIPSTSEQREILEYLDEHLVRHQELVGVAKSTVELLKERRSALISAAVTGKIDVRGWHPPASAISLESAQEAV